jgi:hypothetical protein
MWTGAVADFTYSRTWAGFVYVAIVAGVHAQPVMTLERSADEIDAEQDDPRPVDEDEATLYEARICRVTSECQSSPDGHDDAGNWC